MLIRYLRSIVNRLVRLLIRLLSNGLSKSMISILFRLPNNRISDGIVFNLLDNLEEGPVATRLGFNMLFKHTGYSTSLRKSLIMGTHELPYLLMIKRFLCAGDHVVDIGAHEGYFSLFMSSLVGKTGKVFAIEPNPENLYFLHRNAETNSEHNIQVMEKAISDKKTRAHFNYGDEMGAWGSLIDFPYMETWFKTKKTMEVDVDTLDNLFANADQKIKFFKTDTEGNELNVFLGAEKVLSQHKPHICFEVNLLHWAHLNSSIDTMLNFLRSKGYELFVLEEDDKLHNYTRLSRPSFNMFAIHQSRKAELLNRKEIFY